MANRDLNAATQQPLAAAAYALVSFISLGICLWAGWYLLTQPIVMGSPETSARAYFVLLAILGLASAAFLFGAMRSSARLTGNVYGYALELGGPVVIAVLVVAGGFFATKQPTEFTLVVRLRGTEAITNTQDTFLKVDLGVRRETAVFESGQTTILGVPARFLKGELPIEFASKRYRLKDEKGMLKVPSEGIVYLDVVRVALPHENAIDQESDVPDETDPINAFYASTLANDPEPGRRDWKRLAKDRWEERYPSGFAETFQVRKRIRVGDCPGVRVSKPRAENFEIFIPDRGCPAMVIRYRHNAGAWNYLSQMLDVR